MARIFSIATIALLLAFPTHAQVRRQTALERPYVGCVFVSRTAPWSTASVWDCPPKGQNNAVNVKYLMSDPRPKRNIVARAWQRLVSRRSKPKDFTGRHKAPIAW